MGRTMNKLTKLVLSFLMVITCVNISSIRAEDGEDANYSEPEVAEQVTDVETPSEEPTVSADTTTSTDQPSTPEVTDSSATEGEEDSQPQQTIEEEGKEDAFASAETPETSATDENAGEQSNDSNEESDTEGQSANESVKDYSDAIHFNQDTDVTYNEDNTVATVTMTLDTEDNVYLDFSNAEEAIENNDNVAIDEDETSVNQKTWVFNITANGEYTFEAIAVDNDTLETVGSKEVKVTVDGIEETVKETEEPAESSEVDETEDNISTASLYDQQVAASSTAYNIYHYALIPGQSGESGDPDQSWFGIGVSSVTGLDNPSNYSYGTIISKDYTQKSVVKALFPDITYNGVTYKYATTEEQKSMKGYYTLTPSRLIVSNGANAGNNNYNPTKASGNKTYHLDYAMVLNEENIYTATFNVKYPNETKYSTITDYAQRVSEGTKESELKKPSMNEMTEDGVTYVFDGWYTDEGCTTKANFDGTINSNTSYYGKYVKKTTTITYVAKNGGSVSKAEETFNTLTGSASGSTATPSDGYYFVGWYDNADCTGTAVSTSAAFTPSKPVDGWTDATYYAKFEQKHEVTVKANSTTVTYDGQEHSATGVETYEFTVNGEKYTVSGLSTQDPKATDAGTYTNNVTGTATVTDANGNNVTDQFAVKTENGSLVINKAAVTLKSADLTKEYDGKALTNGDTALATATGFAEGEGATYTFTGSQKLVGSSANAFSYTLNSNTKADNYNITKTEGTLTVTNRDAKYEVTVKANSTTVTYDGQEHSATGVETYEFTVNGEKYTVSGLSTQDPKATDAGTYTNNVTGTATVTDANGNNVTDQFAVKTENGSLVINKAAVTLTAPTDSKVYDGTPLEAREVKVEGTLVAEDVQELKATGSITDEGSVTNGISLIFVSNTKSNNYVVTKNTGTLTVTKQTINPGTDPEKPDPSYKGVQVGTLESVMYNGSIQQQKPLVTDANGNALIEKTDYTLSYSNDTTNVGTVTVTVTGIGNYSGTVERTYNITKRNVTLISDDASKVYDGTPLTATEVTVEGDGFVEGEVSNLTATGTITNVGSVTNGISYTYGDNYKTGNYNVTKINGTLTVTSKSITPDTPDTKPEDKTGITVTDPTSYKYDGNNHQETLTVTDTKTGNALVVGTDYELTYSTEDFKNVGEITITVTGIGNYEGSFTKTYEITKRDITFTSPSASKTYDGSALTSTDIAITGDGFVEGQGASFNVTGSATEVGEVENTFEYAMNEGTNADNYNVTVVNGKLTITAAPVVPSNDTTPTTPVVPATTPTRRTTPVTPAQPEVTPTETPEATVEPTATPSATATPEVIDDDATPEVAAKGNWALINLIAAMVSVLLGVIALIAKHKDEEENDEEDSEEDENTSKRHRTWKIVSAIDAIVAVVAFILTEDITQKMVMVDKWTILMVVLAVVSVVSVYFARKWHEEDEETSEDA